MTSTYWILIWQWVALASCVSFFVLSAVVSVFALRDARDMFRDLSAGRQTDEGEST